jgi:hypothetical protein
MPEQLSPFEQQREALVERLQLREQYEQQIKTLNETGVLEILPNSQEIGIVDIKARECPIPKFEEILARIIPENLVLLERKAEQGFTKLLLVPIGLPLNILTERYKAELLKHDKEGTLLGTDGAKLELDREDPLFIGEMYQNADISGELVYEPREFTKNHQGKTKEELIVEKGAWQVTLTEDLPDLPAEGKGQTIAGRKQFEAYKSSEQYLQAMQTDRQYQGEKGFDPESWLTLAITTLHTKNIQIDDWQGQGKVCFLTASYFRSSGDVPHAYWYRDDVRAHLHRNSPSLQPSDRSARSLVEI